MVIQVSSGTGTGRTKLAAFDAALNDAGVANYNLIHLSSVIPPKSEILDVGNSLKVQPGDWGDKLYVVISDMRVETPNVDAWAGIGWVQDSKTGRGLFAEHFGESKQTVKRDIEQSLKSFMSVRKIDYGAVNMKLTHIVCENEPVCALVVAVFQAEDWL